jgi:hypothetical protein
MRRSNPWIREDLCFYVFTRVGLYESNITVNVLVFEVSSDCYENWK